MGMVMPLSPPAEARIKLVALPQREATVVRLDNPSYTLVEEERILTLQKGTNQVDFSWKGVHIDPDSIRLKILDHPEEVKLISVAYPPDEAALLWEVYTPRPYNERVRISYLLSNLDRLVTYEGLVPMDERTMDLKSYIVLRNFSGEDFDNVTIRLDYGESLQKGIRNEETKRMLFFTRARLPLEKVFTWNDRVQPWDPEKAARNVGIPVYYTLSNTRERGLGEHALWGGKVRVYQEDGHGSTIFLGEDSIDLVPVGEKFRIYIGDSRDIVVTQRKMRDKRIVKERNSAGRPVLYDTDEVIEARIENFKDAPAALILIEHIPGEWEMKSCTHPYKLKDFQTLEFRIELKPKEKVTLTMHYQRRNLR
jgi:hypothetical protein